MRMFLAVLVCKITAFLLGLMGRGSSMPGKAALKIYPGVLGRVKLPPLVVAVTGSNGKTSTVEMIAHVMRKSGKRVIWNKEGSNQIAGVASVILSHCSFSGKVKGDVLLLESDERYAKYSFKYFAPTHYVITNLYRDQLTRNGHPEWVFDAVKDSIREEPVLLLNADDPLVSLYGKNRENVVWFGMDRQSFSTERCTAVYNDGAYCPDCKAPMEYDYFHYAHIGSYHCTSCGHKKSSADYTVTNADLEQGIITINGGYEIKLAFKSIYNVYNLLACFAVCSKAGIDKELIAKELSDYVLKNGRILRYKLGENEGLFLVSKHENSVSYDRSLEYIVRQNKPCAVILIVDAVSRRYSTGETSWLWDIDFGMLSSPCVQKVYLLGKHCSDLLTRLTYAGVDGSRLEAYEDISEATDKIAGCRYENLYTVTCFSDKEKFLSKTQIIDM